MIEQILLDLASKSIEDKLNNQNAIKRDVLIDEYPSLLEKRASFVTLNLNKNLRGCIGSLMPHRPLIDDIIHNAYSAGFEDPRFQPVTKEEFKNIEIEISLLSLPKELIYDDVYDLKSKIRVGIDGVILKHSVNNSVQQATFLPQVWDQLPTFEVFFAHLVQKARLNIDCLDSHPQIFTYQAQKIR